MNNEVFFFLYSFAHQSYLGNKIIFFFAEIFPWIVSLFGIVFLVYWARTKIGKNKEERKKIIYEYILFFTTIGVSLVLSQLIKNATSIPRPYVYFDLTPVFQYGGYDSFPSGHALFFTVIAFSLLSYNKKIGLFFVFSALLISIARVMAGIHYPIDIIGGFLLGFFIVYGVKKFIADSLIIK